MTDPAAGPVSDGPGSGTSTPPPSEDEAEHEGSLDDSGESAEPSAAESSSVRPHPLDGWSDAQIAAAVAHDLPSLGPMSLGSPNAGALLNGVQAGETPYYKPISPSGSWAMRWLSDFTA